MLEGTRVLWSQLSCGSDLEELVSYLEENKHTNDFIGVVVWCGNHITLNIVNVSKPDTKKIEEALQNIPLINIRE